MASFEFIVLDGTCKRPSAATRSHAVKSGLQRKSKPETATGSQDSNLTIRQRNTLKGRFRFTETPAQAKKKVKAAARVQTVAETCKVDNARPDPASVGTSGNLVIARDWEDGQHILESRWGRQVSLSPSQGRGDPFNTFSLSPSRNVDKLMKFFITRFDLKYTQSHVYRQWWGFAVSDPLVMHTTMGLAAAMWSMYVNNPTEVIEDGFQQKCLAIRGIQERIGSGDRSTALVGAVANLANTEGIEGNFKVATLHLKGLQILIKTRGGYSEFRGNANVARTINWADLQTAAGQGSKPLFPLIFPMDSIPIPASVQEAAEQPSLSHLRGFEKSNEHTDVRYNFSLIRQALYALRTEALSYDDLRIFINGTDHQLASTLSASNLTDQGRILLEAARLFAFVNTRETRALCLIPRLMARRLRETLREGFGLFEACSDSWHALIWILCIAAASSWESGENWDFFSVALPKAIQMAQVQDVMELQVILRRFLWDASFPGVFVEKHGPRLFTSIVDL
ncbi:hypothetical protein G7046_g618 [Stylonectria norvegica]|nr:hypothetical protein G7046_g618 [Stylonectria norvegica]